MEISDDMASERIGRYHVIGKIAQGGMAEVLLAKIIGAQGFERPVVIKRILPGLVADEAFVDLFLDEAKLIAGIRHPNVVQVTELSEDKELFLVMEYLAGETVSSLLKRMSAKRKRIPYSVCAHIIGEACAGLHAAHELRDQEGNLRNVVHRDISPQNLFITYEGTVKVIDFGIAKATQRTTQTEAGQLKGKFAYMAPENCKGGTLDRRTDIFALATVLYEMSCGVRLFKRATDMETLEAVCYEPVKPPSLVVNGFPKQLERIILKGLAKDPAQRYQTCADMRRDLVAVSHEESAFGLPEEILSNAMDSLFADRITEKEQMLREVLSGAKVSFIPPADSDNEISVPEIPTDNSKGLTALSVTGLRALKDPSFWKELEYWVREKEMWVRSQERWKLVLAASVIFLPILILSVLDSDKAPRPIPRPSLNPPPRATTKLPPASKTEVVFDLNTQPEGANVHIDGIYKGITPTRLRLPRSESPIFLELSMPKYVAISETVVPDDDIRVNYTFVHSSDAPATTKKPTKKTPAKTKLPTGKRKRIKPNSVRKTPTTRKRKTPKRFNSFD